MSRHRFPCADDDCDFCPSIAEDRAADIEPEYDVEAAENTYERAMWGDL
jgi:hypothetical protein